jgi:hypothetical protein
VCVCGFFKRHLSLQDEAESPISSSHPSPSAPTTRLCSPQEILTIKSISNNNNNNNANNNNNNGDDATDDFGVDCVVSEEEDAKLEEAEEKKAQLIQGFTIGIVALVLAVVVILCVMDIVAGGRSHSLASCDACRRCALAVWAVMDRFHFLQEQYDAGESRPYVSIRTLIRLFNSRGADRLVEEGEEGEELAQQNGEEGEREVEGRGQGDPPNISNPVDIPQPSTSTTAPATTPTTPALPSLSADEDVAAAAAAANETDDDGGVEDGAKGGARRKRGVLGFLRGRGDGYKPMPSSSSSSGSSSGRGDSGGDDDAEKGLFTVNL